MMHRLAIYDMDRTITRSPTWTPYLLSTARANAPWRLTLLPAAGIAAAGYAAKLIDRGRLKQAWHRMLLGTLDDATVARNAAAFADRVVQSGVFSGARDRIAADRADGYRLVMATASYLFYARAIADRLGFDDVIATESTLDERGRITARIAGENCYGPAKLRMIEAWLQREGIAREDAHIRFYSDHVSDAPVLAWADEPFAVNAHEKLRRLAERRGWPVLRFAR